MQVKPLVRLLPLFLCTAVYAGCTSSKEPDASKQAHATETKPATEAETTTETKPAAQLPPPAPTGKPVVSAKVENNVVELAGNDRIQYDANEIRVKGGDKVTVNLTHTGQLPVTTMGHNFVLLKSGVDMAAFATKALAAKGTDYIPEGDEVIAHTKLIGGGESTSITFDAPEPGTYVFLCTFPGHYSLMNGNFIVE